MYNWFSVIRFFCAWTQGTIRHYLQLHDTLLHNGGPGQTLSVIKQVSITIDQLNLVFNTYKLHILLKADIANMSAHWWKWKQTWSRNPRLVQQARNTACAVVKLNDTILNWTPESAVLDVIKRIWISKDLELDHRNNGLWEISQIRMHVYQFDGFFLLIRPGEPILNWNVFFKVNTKR